MNTPTPTPRTDAATYPADCLGKTLVTNRDCARELERELTALTAERDQLRAEIELDEQLQAATEASLKTLTAERDQLRFENSNLRAGQKACEACDEPMAFEVQQLLARAERAEADAERYRLAWQILSKVVAKLRAEVERLRSKEGAK